MASRWRQQLMYCNSNELKNTRGVEDGWGRCTTIGQPGPERWRADTKTRIAGNSVCQTWLEAITRPNTHTCHGCRAVPKMWLDGPGGHGIAWTSDPAPCWSNSNTRQCSQIHRGKSCNFHTAAASRQGPSRNRGHGRRRIWEESVAAFHLLVSCSALLGAFLSSKFPTSPLSLFVCGRQHIVNRRSCPELAAMPGARLPRATK